MSTPSPARNRWAAWLWGKALPLIICTLLAVAIVKTILSEVLAMPMRGTDIQVTLGLARQVLTLAFVLLIAAVYLIRAEAVVAARGFRERVFPVLVLIAGPAGVVLLSRQSVVSSPALASFGLIVDVVGGVLTVWALAHLRTSFSVMVEARRIVTTGPYRFLRHPLYLGEALALFGLCLMIGTIESVLFALTLNTLQLVRARLEETKLAFRFPAYREYRSRTPFIVPGLRMVPAGRRDLRSRSAADVRAEDAVVDDRLGAGQTPGL
jgi:protein-S-isoprenylcysteine O-methyltransferase Ste14